MKWERKNYSSGAPLEDKVGYSRTVQVGPFIFVGGTTSVQSDGTVYGENDGYAQTKYILEKMLDCLAKAGGKPQDVVKVKMYATDMKRAQEYAKAYSEYFKEIKPLCTLVGIAELNRPSQLIEIEMEAVVTNL